LFGREKADLWEKADSLEYESLFKAKAVWQEDANAKQCVECNKQFSFILRKVNQTVCWQVIVAIIIEQVRLILSSTIVVFASKSFAITVATTGLTITAG
jgi:hypothetical protein